MRALVPNAEVVMRSLDLETLIVTAQQGLGALVVADPIAAASGGLIHAPVPTPEMPTGQLWLATHRALRPVPRVAVTWDWLRQMFTGDDGAISTTMPRSGARPRSRQ